MKNVVGSLRDNLTLHSANVVYTTLIRRILDYCDTVWGCCGEGNAQALQALQNRGARIIARTDRSSPARDIRDLMPTRTGTSTRTSQKNRLN